VVTNNHVVSESSHVVLINKDGQEIIAWSVVRDEVNDIALLEVNDSQYLPSALPLSDTKIRPGARVFTIGFPGPHISENCRQSQTVLSAEILALVTILEATKQRCLSSRATVADPC